MENRRWCTPVWCRISVRVFSRPITTVGLLPTLSRSATHSPRLPNRSLMVNAHAGILYESAYDYFVRNADWADKKINLEDSKIIIAAAFKSLVKIDKNRPVRNRCTLNEITGIINRPDISTAAVCGVLNIFRLPDNTLLRPFIESDNVETQYLSGDTVLDFLKR